MLSRKVKVKNRTGLHARPAAKMAEIAEGFEAEVKLLHAGEEANVKSVMGLMSLAISSNTTVTLQAEGKEAEEALDALEEIIEAGFGEKN